METSHFWVGQVPEDIAGEFFVETYAEDQEETPVSAFARDQGIRWYDHDFLEYGWGTADTIQQLVDGYSYSEQWGEELARRAAESALKEINFFVFISEDGCRSQSRETDIGCGTWARSSIASEWAGSAKQALQLFAPTLSVVERTAH